MPEIYIPKKALATSWVTTANISLAGTTAVSSGAMPIQFDNLGNFYDWTLEIEAIGQRTAGTGSGLVWCALSQMIGNFVADNTDGGITYTSHQYVDQNSVKRIWKIKNNILQNGRQTGNNRLYVYIRARGSAADTEVSLSGMQSRLVYTPL